MTKMGSRITDERQQIGAYWTYVSNLKRMIELKDDIYTLAKKITRYEKENGKTQS